MRADVRGARVPAMNRLTTRSMYPPNGCNHGDSGVTQHDPVPFMIHASLLCNATAVVAVTPPKVNAGDTVAISHSRVAALRLRQLTDLPDGIASQDTISDVCKMVGLVSRRDRTWSRFTEGTVVAASVTTWIQWREGRGVGAT